MRITATQPLFAWATLEDSPSLETVRRCLEAIPDASLLQGLRQARGHGRDDYPVSVLWGVAVLTPLLRHPSYDGCLAELRRNPTLCRLLGVETAAQIPHHWNLSRFLDVLGHPAHLAAMRVSFDAMVRRLASVVPDLGRRTAGDATALNARRGEAARQQAEVKLGLPQPGGGRKEYLDAEGKVERVVEWFGYKLHLLVDVRHELALAYWITEPAVGDNQMIAALLEQARANLPEGRIESLAYDKAADDEAVHRLLHKAGIKPLIENRALWKGEPERMLPGHTGRSNLVYDESGTIHCYDKMSMPMVRHRMAYVGHEVNRGTLKYRCPARHEGWSCPSDCAVQRGPNLWISGADQERTGPAAVPADPAHDQTIRALVQGTHGGGASQCPLEAVLGCRRRQRGGGTTVARYGGRGDAGASGLGHGLGGKGPRHDQDTEWDPPEPDRASAQRANRARAIHRARTMSDHDNV